MKTYAFITGASAGIGKAYAYAFAQRGYNLVLVARRTERLEEIRKDITDVHGVDVQCHGVDLTQRNAREKLIQAVEELPLEIVVNNAGFGDYGAFESSGLEKQLAMIDLNIAALVHLSHALLPVLHNTVSGAQARRGYIMNIGSVAGFVPGPYMANYFASKAYVLSFSEALAEECSNMKKNIHVCVVCPGPTQSEFNEVAVLGRENTTIAKAMRETSWNKIPTAEDLAEYSIKHMMRKKRIIVHGAKFRGLQLLFRFLPRIVITKIIGSVQATRRSNN